MIVECLEWTDRPKGADNPVVQLPFDDRESADRAVLDLLSGPHHPDFYAHVVETVL